MRTGRPAGAASNGPPAGATAVCLLWRHPLVATEFRARLAGEPFAVTDIRIRGDQDPIDSIPEGTRLVAVDSEDGSALPVLAGLATRLPSAITVVLSENFDEEEVAFRFLRSGAKALVSYAELQAQLPRALESVASGGFWVPRALLSRFVEVTVQNAPRQRPASPAALTPREGEILEDLLQNLSNKEIAQRRRLTSRTIKFHVSNVLAKYGVKRRADLLLLSLPRH